MYTAIYAKIQTIGNTHGKVMSNIGVKQGCPLFPTLFGLYFDGLETYLDMIDIDSPCLFNLIGRLPIFFTMIMWLYSLNSEQAYKDCTKVPKPWIEAPKPWTDGNWVSNMDSAPICVLTQLPYYVATPCAFLPQFLTRLSNLEVGIQSKLLFLFRLLSFISIFHSNWFEGFCGVFLQWWGSITTNVSNNGFLCD
jgi:hypothetical protein